MTRAWRLEDLYGKLKGLFHKDWHRLLRELTKTWEFSSSKGVKGCVEPCGDETTFQGL